MPSLNPRPEKSDPHVCVGNPTDSRLSLAPHIVGTPWRPEPSSQGFPVWRDNLHGIHAVKINMNSSGPSLRGSQREARSPAHVCSRQEQTFPCELDSPHSLLRPAGMGVGRGARPKTVSSAAYQTQACLLASLPPPSLPPSLSPSSPISAPRQVNSLQGTAGSSGGSGKAPMVAPSGTVTPPTSPTGLELSKLTENGTSPKDTPKLSRLGI